MIKPFNFLLSAFIAFSFFSAPVSETYGQELPKYNPVIGEYGGERTFSVFQEPESFNIYLPHKAAVTDILNLMYDGLVSTNPITLEIVPELAESWEISEDKLTYTIKLKEGLSWSDGMPLTADDIVFTFNDILGNPELNNIYKDALLIDGQLPFIEKIDDLHIKFMTPVPFSPFLRKLDFPILPKHLLSDGTKRNAAGEILLKTWGGLDSAPSSIICNGPFKLEGYQPGKSLILGKNQYYWKKNSKGLDLPYLDSINIEILPDPLDEYKQFIAKELDSLWITARVGKLLKPKEKDLNFSIKPLEQTSGSLFVMFNLSTAKDIEGKQIVNPVKSAWFRNPLFRKALAYSIDKKAIISRVYNDFAISQYSSFSPNTPFSNPYIQKYKYDLKIANKLLKAGGFKKNKAGNLIDSKGNKVSFDLFTGSGNTIKEKTIKMIIGDWKKLGISANLKLVTTEDLTIKTDQKLNWDAIFMGLPGNNIEPNDNYSLWDFTSYQHMFNMGNSTRNPYWFDRETSYEKWETDIQNLYEKAALEFNNEKRKELYFQAQEIEAENLPFLYTVQPVSFVAVRNNIGNVFPAGNSGNNINAINWNLEEQFIIKPKN
jgi:peptide/nickel transport system substrate-binding protein